MNAFSYALLKSERFVMLETCENRLGLVNSCVYYATRPMKFTKYCLTQWISKLPGSKTVLRECSYISNKGPVNIWNDRRACKYFPNFLHCLCVAITVYPIKYYTVLLHIQHIPSNMWLCFALLRSKMSSWWIDTIHILIFPVSKIEGNEYLEVQRTSYFWALP